MRKVLLFGIFILTGACFIGRLFYLQIYESSAYDLNNDNAIRKVFHLAVDIHNVSLTCTKAVKISGSIFLAPQVHCSGLILAQPYDGRVS